MNDFIPKKDLVVIEIQPEPKEKEGAGGFFFQAPKWAKPGSIAKVLKKGPMANDVSENEVVLINPYAVIDTNEENIKLIRMDDILCQIPSTEA